MVRDRGLATEVHPVVTQTDSHRTVMVRRGQAMAVPQAANAKILCILTTSQATDGIAYLISQLTHTTESRCLTIGISRITQPIQVRLIEALLNLFVILKRRSVAIRKGMHIPNSNTQNALIKWVTRANTGIIFRLMMVLYQARASPTRIPQNS